MVSVYTACGDRGCHRTNDT